MKITNTAYPQAVSRTLGLKGENITEAEDILMPIVDIKPTINVFGAAQRTTSGTSTLLTTATDRDTYITNVTISGSGDVLANTSQVEVYGNINNVARSLAKITHTVGATGSQAVSIQFAHPLRLDRGINVSFAVVFAAGAYQAVATIFGYTSDTQNSGV